MDTSTGQLYSEKEVEKMRKAGKSLENMVKLDEETANYLSTLNRAGRRKWYQEHGIRMNLPTF